MLDPSDPLGISPDTSGFVPSPDMLSRPSCTVKEQGRQKQSDGCGQQQDEKSSREDTVRDG